MNPTVERAVFLRAARDFVGKGMSEEAWLASMDAAAEMGIALFDTAERYAAGESERAIDRWRESRPSSVTHAPDDHPARDEAPPAGSLVDIGYLDPVTPALHDALDRLRAAADGLGTSTGALALAWLIAHPGVAALTTGPSRTSPHLALVDAASKLHVSADDAATWGTWFRAAATDSDSSP